MAQVLITRARGFKTPAAHSFHSLETFINALRAFMFLLSCQLNSKFWREVARSWR